VLDEEMDRLLDESSTDGMTDVVREESADVVNETAATYAGSSSLTPSSARMASRFFFGRCFAVFMTGSLGSGGRATKLSELAFRGARLLSWSSLMRS
jgi:hypothetical protein